MRLQIARGNHAGPRPVLTCELLQASAARGAMCQLEQEVVFTSHSLEIFHQFLSVLRSALSSRRWTISSNRINNGVGNLLHPQNAERGQQSTQPERQISIPRIAEARTEGAVVTVLLKRLKKDPYSPNRQFVFATAQGQEIKQRLQILYANNRMQHCYAIKGLFRGGRWCRCL
jgi:hypothetical protein